jgi:mycothiol synthase
MSIVPDLPEGLLARPPVPDDAAAVFELYATCEAMVQGEPDVELDDIVADWRRPSFDLGSDAVLVLEGGTLVAEAEVFKGRRAEVAVHPHSRNRGIGSALLDWTRRRASEVGSTMVGQTTPDADEAARELFRANGYEPMWSSWVLSYEIDGPPAPPELPDGYSFRPFEIGRDDREVYEVVERAFGEWPDREPYAYGDWRALTVETERFDPTLQIVIARGDAIVGTASTSDPGPQSDGWVHQLAVAREHRGLGLGRALLQRSFALFHEQGKTSVQLSTDSRTGALGLYEHVGMRVVRSYTHHAKRL